jgi:WD40 repeat protein
MFQSIFAVALLSTVTKVSFVGEKQPFLDLILDFIFFRAKMKLSVSEKELPPSVAFSRILSALEELPPSEFSLNIVNGKWIDLPLIWHFAVALSWLTENVSERFLVGYSFAFHEINFKDNQLPVLDRIVSLVPEDSPAWTPLLYQAAKQPDVFPESGLFKRKFCQCLKLTHHLFEDANDEIVKFINLYQTSSSIDRDIFFLLRGQPVMDKLESVQPETRIPSIRRSNENSCKRFVRSWRRLSRLISHDGSPFVNRWPIGPFVNRLDRSFKMWLSVPKSWARRYVPEYHPRIFSTFAERIKPNRTVKGIFSVQVDGYVFTDSDSYSFLMPKKSIKSIFLAGKNGIQIFLSDFQGFLFQFSSHPLEQILGALRMINPPEISFFQMGEPQDEVSRIHLLKFWQSQQISLLDFLLSVNYLFGKSFFSPTNRPIFPQFEEEFIFDDNTDLRLRKLEKKPEMIVNWLSSSDFHITCPSPIKTATSNEIERTITFNVFESPIVSIGIIGSTIHTLKLFAATQSGKIVEFHSNCSGQEIKVDCPIEFVAFTKDSIIRQSISGFSIAELRIGEGYWESSITPHFSRITALITEANLILTGGDDGSVAIWRNLEKCEVMFSHSDSLTCIAASEQYGVLVSGAKDESLVVALIPEGSFVRRIQIGFVAKRVLITRNCGYIVVSGCEQCQSYTINGMIRGGITMNGEVVEMCAVSLKNGNDYAAIVVEGAVVLYDACEMLKIAVVYEMHRVSHVRWSEPLNMIVVATEKGSIVGFPLKIPDWAENKQ